MKRFPDSSLTKALSKISTKRQDDVSFYMRELKARSTPRVHKTGEKASRSQHHRQIGSLKDLI